MNILKLFLLTQTITLCYSEVTQVFNPFNPVKPPLGPICPPAQKQILVPPIETISANITSVDKHKENLKFIVPFMDMEIHYDYNTSMHIMEEVQKQQIYILHGNELYQLFISRREKRLSLMAVLEGSVRHLESLGAKIIYWNGSLLLVVALDEHLEVYQLNEAILMQRAEIVTDLSRSKEPAPIFEVIQKLTLTGRFQKLFLFSPVESRIMIVAAVNFTKLHGKFRTFEWLNTYFNPVEEITIPAIDMVNVVGAQTKYLISGKPIKHQTRTILNVYEINTSSLRFMAKQTLTVKSRIVHIFTYHNYNIIVACSSEQPKCSSFRQMPDGQFSVYRYRTSKEFAFDLLTSSKKFVAATRQNQVMVFTNHRLDCYASFMSDQMDITELMGHQNADKEDYVLLVYKRPFKVLMRIVELEINADATDLATDNQTETEGSTHDRLFFESTVGQLRSVLLHRKVDMDVLRKVTKFMKPKIKNFEATEPITMHEGKVGIIKIVNDSLRTPQQLLEKINTLRKIYLASRTKRSDSEGNGPSLQNTSRVKVNKLKVRNLIYQGDVIEGFSLNQIGNQQKILYIKPKVVSHTLNTSEVVLPLNIRERETRQQYISDLFLDITPPPVRVSHLLVEYINGVRWQKFYYSLFLKNRDKVLRGSLVLQSQANVNHLTSTTLNGLVVSNLFDLKQPQIIYSDLVISRFFLNDLKAKTVNGLTFEEDIVFSGNDTLIETPVTMHHLSISGDLILSDDTKKLESKQFYTNKVIINGNVMVNNLKRENVNKTKIILGDEEYNEQDIKEKYLLRNEPQNFSLPIIFNEAKVKAPYLVTTFLNYHKTEQHLLVDKVNSNNGLLAVFMNAHVEGNVICRDYKSKISQIKENIVRPGDKVHMSGIKIFENSLVVNEAQVLSLNEKPVEHLIFKSLLKNSKSLRFKDLKNFTNIRVRNTANIEMQLQVSYLNHLPLEDLLNTDYHMDRVYVPNLLRATNIVFQKLNGISFNEFFNKLIVKDRRLVLHKDLIVEGNIEFAQPLEVKYVNDIAWNVYVENLVHYNESAIIEGNVSFYDDVTVTKTFETSEINGSDLEFVLTNILMKSKHQLITGLYHFGYMNVSRINALKINNVNVKEFLDLSKNFTEIDGVIIVEKLNVKGNLLGNLREYDDLFNLKEKIKELVAKPWKNLYVLRNVSWPAKINDNSQHELLKYFYKIAVKSNQDQTITGNVKITKPLINKMQTRLQFPPTIQLDFIYQDALFRNSSVKQIIKGEKVFLKTLYLNSLQTFNLNTRLLNKIDVVRFNQSLYRFTSREPLPGPLRFISPLTIGHLQINGLINGLNHTLIYQLTQNSTMPAVNAFELYVDKNIFIKNINNMNLEYFLNNRFTLKGPSIELNGVLTFENLIITKEALMQSINGIPIDTLVFKHSPYLQTVMGHKTMENSLELVGPCQIMRINNIDLMELYHTSLRKDENYQFQNVLIEQATFEQGLELVRNINLRFQQSSFSDIGDLRENNEENFLKFLKEFKQNLTLLHKDILYFDYDLNATIKWRKPHSTLLNKTIRYELTRISLCEKQFLKISFHPPNDYYLQNITSNRVTVITSKRISVKAENYCRYLDRKMKSKISISGQKLLKVFGMKRFIETIYILDLKISFDQLIILHALDLPSLKRNEVRIFKMSAQNNSINNWQSLTQNIGEQLKLYKLSNLNVLLTNGFVAHHPALTIYHFNSSSQLFDSKQIIDGAYDIIEMLEMPNAGSSKQLILTCSKCQRIFIYELNISQSLETYDIFQIISLKSSIDKLVLFPLHNDFYMLVISQSYSHVYNVYKYCYIQGWRHLTYGYFPNFQMSVPLTELWFKGGTLVASYNSEGIPLILLCNLYDCYLVKAIV